MRAGEFVTSRFRLEVRLGAGGFGAVWRGRDVELGRGVAIKLLHEEAADRATRDRFLEEARITSSLSHPHVVSLYDFGFLEGGRPFLVYELVEGGSLASPGRVRATQLREWGIQLASALAASHAAGVVHRDVKPENVLLRDGDEAVLCDFGIARNTSRNTRLTEAGLLMGTPAYMAPELWVGGVDSPAADQFAWAATLLAVAGGGSVYGDGQVSAILEAVRARRPLEVPACPPLGERSRAVLTRALSQDPRDRYPGMAAVEEAWGEAFAKEAPGAGAAAPAAGVGSGADEAPAPLLSTPPAHPGRGAPPPRGQTTKPSLRGRRGRILVAVAGVAALVGPLAWAALMSSGPSPAELVRRAEDGGAILRHLTAARGRYSEAEAGGGVGATTTTTTLDRASFEADLLAHVDALLASLAAPADRLAPGHWAVLLRREAAAPRVVLGQLQQLAVAEAASPRAHLVSSLRAELERRLVPGPGEPVLSAPQVALLASLLGALRGEVHGPAYRAAVEAVPREPRPLLRAWTRLRLLEQLGSAADGGCSSALTMLEDLVPPSAPRGADPDLEALREELESALLGVVYPLVVACPYEVRPAAWRLLDRGLEAVDRELMASPEAAARVAARLSRILEAAPPEGPPLVSYCYRRLEKRRVEAAALASEAVPPWVRDLPPRLAPGTEPGEALRRLEGLLGRCRRILLAEHEEVPPAAWPWLVRRLLTASILEEDLSGLLRGEPGGTDTGDAAEVRKRILAQAREDGAPRLLGYSSRKQRMAVLAMWILAQAGEPIDVDVFEMSTRGLLLEQVPVMRACLTRILLETLEFLLSGEKSYCRHRARYLSKLADTEGMEDFPEIYATAARRIFVEGYALASNCPASIPEGFWELLERARADLEAHLRRDPTLVAATAQRAITREHFGMGLANPREVVEFRDRLIRLKEDAEAYQLSIQPEEPPPPAGSPG